MTHVHRLRPIWLLVMSPAWNDGYHKVVAHAQCILCGHTTYVSAWQSPAHRSGRQEDDDAG